VFALVVLACVLAAPGLARAQSTIAGTVRDLSGGVLPGVVVEAESDVLIERVRTAVTDGLGQYQIVDLRPGLYVVTFALPGFQTFRREGLELVAEFTLTVDAVMQVGAIEETITVRGAASAVDIQSAARIQRMDRNAIENIPSGRTLQAMGQLILGVNLNLPDVGGSRANMQTYMSVRGQGAAQNTLMIDGLTVNSLQADGAVLPYVNESSAAEVTYQTSGAGAERSGGGLVMNVIPREGGNRFSGDASMAHRPGGWQGDNLTQRLQDAGLLTPNSIDYISDMTIAQGGPVLRDRLWFFGSYRDFRTNNIIPNAFFDDGSPASDYNYQRQALIRLTYQINARHKLSAFYDRAEWYRAHDMQANTDPETAAVRWLSPNFSHNSLKWTGTLSNSLLAEVGYSQNVEWYIYDGQDGNRKPTFSEEWYANASKTIPGITGLRTTSPALFNGQYPVRRNAQASLSWVTGQHNVKAGFQWQWGYFEHWGETNAHINQYYTSFTRVGVGREIVFSNPINPVLGVPVGAVILGSQPLRSRENLNRDLGIYIQDSWRYKRLTVNAGLRYEEINASVEETTADPGRFVPSRTQPRLADIPNWSDWAPRFQVIYDLFGNARTAVKYSFARYNQAAGTNLTDDFNGLTLRTANNRTWVDLNKDDIAQGARTWFPDGTYRDCVFIVEAGCEINLSGIAAGNPWGLPAQAALVSNFGLISEASVYTDYGRRYRVEHGVEIQHSIHPRLTASMSFFYSNLENITKTVNLNRNSYETDYFTYTVFDPITGESFLFYNPTTAFEARPTNNTTIVEPLSKSVYDTYQFEMRWRPTAGGQVFGGFAWARTRSNDCQTSLVKADGTPALVDPNTLRLCDDFAFDVPYAVDFRAGVSYPLPFGITFGMSILLNDEGSFTPTYLFNATTRYPDGSATGTTARFINGLIINNSAKVTGRQPAPACPAPCPAGQLVAPTYSGVATGRTVTLAHTGQYDAERLKQVDIRLSKTFRYGGVTISPTFEAFNITNSDKVITVVSSSYAHSSGTYLQPNSMLQGRMLGWGVRVAW
jgi:hypothetical protein